MPGYRRRLAALAAAGMLAAPATALGQSAGDDQYEDPFAGEQQGQSQGGGSQEPAAPAAPTPEPAAPGSTAPVAEPELQVAPASGPVPASQPQLPRTGADTGSILIAGTMLLAGGVALRLRLRDRA